MSIQATSQISQQKQAINKSAYYSFKLKNLSRNRDRFLGGERWVSNPRPTVPQTVALTY